MGWRSTVAAIAMGTMSLGGGIANAGPVVIELFTSQGCSSCPPADAFLAEIADNPDIVALSLHVDYWDYLGWSDVFAKPEHTRRQISYREKSRARSVYTPQMVVNGQEFLVGSRKRKVMEKVEAHQSAGSQSEVVLRRVNGKLEATITPSAATGGGVVWLITYDHPKKVAIGRGENGGRNIVYHNVVTSWMRLGDWSGSAQVLSAPMPSMGRGVAVIVQDGEVGPVLGAAKLEF